ncbi:MAG TPA: TlpA disulfide reductase family protein [Patescibacteria group bacterium]|nr:TlpA disulfide reductase family protein [Patescibacteria group bacterium]
MKTSNIFKTSFLGILVTVFSLGCNSGSSENKAEASTGDQLASTENTAGATVTPAAEPAQSTSRVYQITNVSASAGNKLTDFSWTQDGRTVSLSEVGKGKVVFLNFWATWCGPCRKEIPDIIELSKELPAQDFVAVGVALDNTANAASLVNNYVTSKNMTYLNLLGNQKVTEAYGGITSIPTTFIFDKNGNQVEKIVGSQSKQEFLASISKYLK